MAKASIFVINFIVVSLVVISNLGKANAICCRVSRDLFHICGSFGESHNGETYVSSQSPYFPPNMCISKVCLDGTLLQSGQKDCSIDDCDEFGCNCTCRTNFYVNKTNGVYVNNIEYEKFWAVARWLLRNGREIQPDKFNPMRWR